MNFNKGVLDYFKIVQYKKTGIKNYIVTSGLQEYIYETPIKNYIQGAYGVTFKEKDGIYTEDPADPGDSARGKRTCFQAGDRGPAGCQ